MKTADGRLYVVGGASRSGKTAWVAQHVKAARRVVAYDPEDQWAQLPGWRRVTSLGELRAALLTRGAFRVAFVPRGGIADAFAALCLLAFALAQDPAYGAFSFIAEELADVTMPAKAPEKWGMLTRRGLKRGVTIYAISQRWSEADKTAFGNASAYVIFRQSSGDDVRYFSRKTGIDAAEIAALTTEFWPGTEDVKRAPFMIKDTRTLDVRRSELKFPRRR